MLGVDMAGGVWGVCSPYMRTRSAKEYSAQTLGAQYAWQSPLEKGNSRPSNCGTCSSATNGPNAAAKIAAIPPPSFRQFRIRGRNTLPGDRQYARSRKTKYAGAR